jgi:hypothetical protein
MLQCFINKYSKSKALKSIKKCNLFMKSFKLIKNMYFLNIPKINFKTKIHRYQK